MEIVVIYRYNKSTMVSSRLSAPKQPSARPEGNDGHFSRRLWRLWQQRVFGRHNSRSDLRARSRRHRAEPTSINRERVRVRSRAIFTVLLPCLLLRRLDLGSKISKMLKAACRKLHVRSGAHFEVACSLYFSRHELICSPIQTAAFKVLNIKVSTPSVCKPAEMHVRHP
jgi:hypothetical protein